MGERREVRHGHAIAPRGPFILAHPLPGLPKLLGGERQRHVRLELVIRGTGSSQVSGIRVQPCPWWGRLQREPRPKADGTRVCPQTAKIHARKPLETNGGTDEPVNPSAARTSSAACHSAIPPPAGTLPL